MAVTFAGYTVPAKLETVAKYAKFILAVAAVVAGIVVQVVAGPPAWALLIIAVAGALGVGVVPNGQLAAGVQDVEAILRDGKAVLGAADAGNLAGAETALKDAESKVSDAKQVTQTVVTEVKGVQTQTDRPAGPTS